MFEDYIFRVDDFIDRKEETKSILHEIETLLETKVILLCSPTGVGKSSLVNRVVLQVDSMATVRIKTAPMNIGASTEKGIFLQELFKMFVNVFKEDKSLSFKSYITSSKNKKMRSIMHEKIIDKFSENKIRFGFLKFILALIYKRIMKLGEFNYLALLDYNDTSNRNLMNQYIQSIMSSVAVFLSIDNIHNIDEISLRCLLDWINIGKDKRHYVCLEYTLTDINTYSDVLIMVERIKETGVNVTVRRLNYMDSEYAVQIIKNITLNKTIEKFESNAIYYYETLGQGNLRKLIDYATTITPVLDTISNYDPTLEKIQSIENRDALYILSIIINCNGLVSKHMFEGISTNDPLIVDKNKKLIYLTENRFIKFDNNIIYIEHASIIDTWNNYRHQFVEYDLLAYKRLKIFLEDCIDKNNTFFQSHEKNFMLLLHLYNKYEPVNLILLLDNLEKMVAKYMTPEKIWGLIETIIYITKNKVAECLSIYYKIVKICFSCELYQNGLSCINIIEENTFASIPVFYLYKCMILTALDKHFDSISILEFSMKKFDHHQQFLLCAKLILINNYRSTNQTKKCIEVANLIRNEPDYLAYDEYGYFLRLADLYSGSVNALPIIEESIIFFEHRNIRLQAEKTRINYSMQLALANKLTEARRQIDLAENSLRSITYVASHMFLVNKVAICLLSKNFTNEVWEDLEEAEQSAIVPFDKLAILNNKLIWCIENKAYSKINFILNKILRLLCFEPDMHIHAIIYYNIYLAYDEMGHKKFSQKYHNLAWNHRDYCSSLKSRMEGTVQDNRFILNLPWHVCFLAYWEYDILISYPEITHRL